MAFDELDENGNPITDIGARIMNLAARQLSLGKQSLYAPSQELLGQDTQYLTMSDPAQTSQTSPQSMQNSGSPVGARIVDLTTQQRLPSRIFQPPPLADTPSFSFEVPRSPQSPPDQPAQRVAPGSFEARGTQMHDFARATVPSDSTTGKQGDDHVSTDAPFAIQAMQDEGLSADPQNLDPYSYTRNQPLTGIESAVNQKEERGTDELNDGHPGSPGVAEYSEGQSSPGRAVDPKTRSKTPINVATTADKESGNFIEVGFRHTKDWKSGHLFNHAYIGIPEVKDGRWTGNMDYYEVLGNKGSTKNQQVRNSTEEQRHVEAKGSGKNFLAVSPAQKEALSSRLQYFSEHDKNDKKIFFHPCPSCGSRYHALEPEEWNSNTFVHNMLIHNPAGRIEPPEPSWAFFGTPGYKVNAPYEHWYK